MQWGKGSLFNKTVLGKPDSYLQKNKIGTLFTIYTKINSEWIKDLNVRTETKNFLKETASSNFFDFSHNLLDMSPKERDTKAKINYWDYIKIKKKKKTFAQQRK